MTPLRSRPALLLLLVIAVPVLLGASCEASVGTGDSSLTGAKLEKSIIDQLESNNEDVEVEELTCDEKLEAKVDATVHCTGVFAGTDGLEQLVRVRVDEVDGSNANYTISVIQRISPDAVAEKASGVLSQQNDGADVALDCGEEPLDIEEGVTATCDAEVDGEALDAEITFTDDDGAFDVELVE